MVTDAMTLLVNDKTSKSKKFNRRQKISVLNELECIEPFELSFLAEK